MNSQTIRDVLIIVALVALVSVGAGLKVRLTAEHPEAVESFWIVVGGLIAIATLLGFIPTSADAGEKSMSVLRRVVIRVRATWLSTLMFSASCLIFAALMIRLTPPMRAVPTDDEINVLNEWVDVIAEGSESEAIAAKKRFDENYPMLNHRNGEGKVIWHPGTVHVVRSLDNRNAYLVAIDMYPGPSTQECIRAGIAEMKEALAEQGKQLLAGQYRELHDNLDLFLHGTPLCYDMGDFESTFGTMIDNDKIGPKRALGSCKEKIRRHHPERFCEQDLDS